MWVSNSNSAARVDRMNESPRSYPLGLASLAEKLVLVLQCKRYGGNYFRNAVQPIASRKARSSWSYGSSCRGISHRYSIPKWLYPRSVQPILVVAKTRRFNESHEADGESMYSQSEKVLVKRNFSSLVECLPTPRNWHLSRNTPLGKVNFQLNRDTVVRTCWTLQVGGWIAVD